MATFSPGPWVIVDEDYGPYDESNTAANTLLPVGINDANGESVLRVSEGWGVFFGEDQPDGAVAWANARLLEAAPDLLAACEAYIAAEDGNDPMTAFDGMTRARALMDRAIAKAKGNDDA